MTTRDEDWTSGEGAALFDAVLSLETINEAASFFRDLCTRRELEEMVKRWAAARQLDEGIPYRTVAKQVGLSTATVTRIAQWLRHGTGGYRAALDREKAT